MKPPNVLTKVIVSSPEKNTSLMFLEATKHGEIGNVLYISKTAIIEVPNDENFTKVADKNILRRISFIYPTSWSEIISKLCLIHTWKMIPRAIIVDGLEDFVEFGCETTPSKPALLCTALLDASGISAKISGTSCHLLISIDKTTYDSNSNQVNILLNTYLYGDVLIDQS